MNSSSSSDTDTCPLPEVEEASGSATTISTPSASPSTPTAASQSNRFKTPFKIYENFRSVYKGIKEHPKICQTRSPILYSCNCFWTNESSLLRQLFRFFDLCVPLLQLLKRKFFYVELILICIVPY